MDQKRVVYSQARASPRHHTDEGEDRGNDEDDDAFPLTTQDDARPATVDLGEGNPGRPIDFDEGMGGMSIMVTPVAEPELDSTERSPVALPQPEHQVRGRAGSEPSAGSSSGGPSKVNTRNDAQAQPAAGPPNTASASSTPSTLSTRAGPLARTLIHLPPGMVRPFSNMVTNR